MDTNQRNSARVPQRPRRPRAARACDLCRAKKYKCDEMYPCSCCRARNSTCVYQGSQNSSRRYTAEYVKQLEDEVQRLSTMNIRSTCGQPLGQSGPVSVNVQGPIHDADGTPQTDISASIQHTDEEEISGTNGHTDGIEFYGSSSSFALLSRVQRLGQRSPGHCNNAGLVSSLHNATFQTTPTASHGDGLDVGSKHVDYYPQCRSFVESFFSTIHYVHPILDKHDFLQRCEALWSPSAGVTGPQPLPSFVALYFSVLSVGAIVGIRDEDHIDNLSNLQWSRKFFDIAWTCCHQLGLITSLEMVQCFFMMAKVCQNELNPHWAYMYTGFAVRTALAMGINREPGTETKKTSAQLRAESRTWWGLYSLETEISFSIGRPDTLGADIYHNRRFPLLKPDPEADQVDPELFEPSYCAIIKCMVDLSRITRTICQKIYLANPSIRDMIALTNLIEKELDDWLAGLPHAVRPSLPHQSQHKSSLSAAKGAVWAKRQKLVLSIRYHNLKILLFGSLLIRSSPIERENNPGCMESMQKCFDSAKQTITIIYETYAEHEFFQTWFYNATYTVFAASVLLLYVTQSSTIDEEMRSLLNMVDMAIEVLEFMDESVVAVEAAKLLRRARDKAEGRRSPESGSIYDDSNVSQTALETGPSGSYSGNTWGQSNPLNHYWGSLGVLDGSSMNFSATPQLNCFDQNNPMFLFMSDE